MTTIPRRRTVGDVMTRHVHVAMPWTPFKELVRLILDNHISAVPIIDQQGMPVGVVSESDLMLKERLAELAADRTPTGLWLRRQDREKAKGAMASGLMTSPPITVGEDETLSDAARVMQERRVRRLIVVDSRGRIAGIATRSDLLRVFLRPDESLRDELLRTIIPAVLPADIESVDVRVAFNVITLAGEVDRRSDVDMLGRLAGEIDGVVAVNNHLTYRWDDIRRQARAT